MIEVDSLSWRVVTPDYFAKGAPIAKVTADTAKAGLAMAAAVRMPAMISFFMVFSSDGTP